MEENSNQIIVDIGIDALIASLRELQKQYEANTAAMKAMRDEGKQDSDEYIQLTQANKVLRQEMNGVEKSIQNNIKAEKAQEGSLVQLRAQLANLNKQYDSMSGFERMGKAGQELQEKIARLSTEIQGLEGATGRWQRNVGNYRSALKGMKDATEAAGLSSKGLDRIMKGLSANPWMTIVTVLVTILVKLRDRMKDNEEVTASLGKAMDSLKPIMETIGKVVEKLADIFSNVLDWAIEKTIDALGWLGRQLQKIGNLFGKDWGTGLIDFSNTMKTAANETNEMSEATEELATSQETLQSSFKKTRDALETFLDTYKKVLNEMKKESLYDMLMKAGGTKTGAQVIDEMVQAADELDETLQTMDATIDDSNFNSNEPGFMDRLAASFLNNAQTIESVSSSLQSSFGSLSSIYKQMASDETKTEAEREKAAKKAKAWSALQIAANAGTAVAKGVASAMDVPWPGNMGAIASTLAAVLAAIAQAKALAAEGHEHGGVIGGKFIGATMGSDNTYIHARRGEMVLNAEQQRQLFDIANGTATSSLTASLVTALQSMPAPVLVYSELQEFGNSVNILDTNAKLK